MTAAESELSSQAGASPASAGRAEQGRTNAAVDATLAGDQRSLPLVVLSPGFTNSRSALTALAEDLASNGYVVAGY